jgi:hypothetical protein
MPWTIDNHQDINHVVVNSPERWIAVIQFNGELTLPQQDEIARVMAAGPELLAALRRVYDEGKGDAPEMWAQVEDALELAIGGAT